VDLGGIEPPCCRRYLRRLRDLVGGSGTDTQLTSYRYYFPAYLSASGSRLSPDWVSTVQDDRGRSFDSAEYLVR
jgi:hypothetical protein